MPSKEWEAWIDEMPGKERALYVTGLVEVGNTRLGARLEPERPGINPAIRMLRCEIYEKADVGDDVMTYVPVDQYVEPTGEKYTHVDIQPDGEIVEVKITGATGETS
jgi:hypothetical protein